MRVVHVLKVRGIAGAERHLLTLLSGLRARGIDAQYVLLVSPSNPVEEMMRAAAERGIPAQRVFIRFHVDLTVYYKLWRCLRELKPDIVHTHLQHGDLFGLPVARALRAPALISSRHNDDSRRRNPFIRRLNWLLWKLPHAGIAISEAIARFSIDVEGAHPGKLHTIHYGLEIGSYPPAGLQAAAEALADRLNLPHGTHFIGMVCRLIEQKGVNYALRALALIAADFPTVHLVIAGDGPLRSRLESEAHALGIAERAHFLGWVDDPTAVLAALEILLMPSLREGFGLSMLEAMEQGVPIVGSAVSAIPEVVVSGETGLLVPPGDGAALAAALRVLLDDAALCRHMGLLGRDRLETHFTAARMVDATAALYQRLLSARTG